MAFLCASTHSGSWLRRGEGFSSRWELCHATDPVHGVWSPGHCPSPTLPRNGFISKSWAPASGPGGVALAYPVGLSDLEYSVAVVGVLVLFPSEAPVRLCKAPKKVIVLIDSYSQAVAASLPYFCLRLALKRSFRGQRSQCLLKKNMALGFICQ